MPRKRAGPAPSSPRRTLALRLALSERVALGPGKADLLAAIRETGSIAAAGRRLGMSYQRAHDLVSALNEDFESPLVEATAGGIKGGGARLSALGEEILATYRALEQEAAAAIGPRLRWLRSRLRS